MSSPHLNIGGVDCTISFGPDGTSEGLTESWPVDGPTATVYYRCAWDQRYTLAAALMGSSSYVGGVLVRVPPHAYPTSPNLICGSLGTIQPLGLSVLQSAQGLAPAGWITAQYAIIPATYVIPRYDVGSSSNPPQDPSGQPWTTTRFRISGDVFTPPNRAFKYVSRPGDPNYPQGTSAGVPVADSLFGIVRPQIEISMTRHRVPVQGFSVATITDYIGTLNSLPLTFGDATFEEGHLLFAGFNATYTIDTLGNQTFEVEYGILGRTDYSWNTLMAPDSNWYLVNTQADESGMYPFAYTDFANIP